MRDASGSAAAKLLHEYQRYSLEYLWMTKLMALDFDAGIEF